jgi:hypothetical protein
MTLRPALLAAAALAAAFCVSFALYRWGAGGDRDLAAIVRGVQRGQELDSHFELRWRHNVAKRALANEVVAGRMSLREAAGHFRRLDEAATGIFPPGIPRPDADERALYDGVLDCAWEVLAHEGRFAEAARWYAEVLTAHPHLLAGPPTGHRYNAACAAALAGCGQGRDAADLDEEGRAVFRRQALGWLRAELEARRRLWAGEPAQALPLVHDLKNWLVYPYLAGVREPEALSRLPEAERRAWQKLWTDVADTLARAEGTTPLEQRADSKAPLPER